MSNFKMIVSAAALSAALAVPFAATAKSSDHRTFDGKLVHVSSTNIKVMGTEGGKSQTLSFLVNHGTNMTKMLHAGEYVRVTFDQKLLGVRHADSVMPYGNPHMKMKT